MIFGSIKDEEVKALVEEIKGIRTQDVRNEEDFEKQLFQRLDAKGYNPERQVRIGENKRIDPQIQFKKSSAALQRRRCTAGLWLFRRISL